MLADRYGNALSSRSAAACDAYSDGVDRFLGAIQGDEDAFRAAIAADDRFALAHVALARTLQLSGKGAEAAQAMTVARSLTEGLSAREASHVAALGLLIDGNTPAAYTAIREHLVDYPRDAMVAQTCAGVFGLIGFSGLSGREAELLAFTTTLLPYYNDDWWFLGQHAFAQAEVGQIAPALETIERSLAANPRNAHGAHNRAHIYYEAGETETGYSFLTDWLRDYDKAGYLHCHISWHVAIWALERGDHATMWQVIDADVAPGGAWRPPLNVLTDNTSFLYRAELAGVEIPTHRWQAISDFAATRFPNTGIAFADIHAALAHAKAGNGDAVDRIIAEAKGPAADVVRTVAQAFQAIAAHNWAVAIERLTSVMADQERIGGSRAQRDLVEYALLGALVRQGQSAEARLLLATRRPSKVPVHAVKGL